MEAGLGLAEIILGDMASLEWQDIVESLPEGHDWKARHWRDLSLEQRLEVFKFIRLRTCGLALQGWPGVRILHGEPGQRALHVELPSGAGTAWLVPCTEVWDLEPLLVPDSEFRRGLDLGPDWKPMTDRDPLSGLGVRESVQARWIHDYEFEFWARAHAPEWPNVSWLAEAISASDQRLDNLD